MAETTGKKWTQFRRLLLGVVVECLAEAEVDVVLRSIRIEFDRDEMTAVRDDREGNDRQGQEHDGREEVQEAVGRGGHDGFGHRQRKVGGRE